MSNKYQYITKIRILQVILFLIVSFSSAAYFIFKNSFFENLLTEVIGAAVTLLIIERILRYQKDEKWELVHTIAKEKVRVPIMRSLIVIFSTFEHGATSLYGRPDGFMVAWDQAINEILNDEAKIQPPEELYEIEKRIIRAKEYLIETFSRFKEFLTPEEVETIHQVETELDDAACVVNSVAYVMESRSHDEESITLLRNSLKRKYSILSQAYNVFGGDEVLRRS